MTWNTLTYACGHTDRVQLYGEYAARDATVSRAATHDCPACAAAAAAKQSADVGLPALVGSDKQIVWAQTIRATCLAGINTDYTASLPADKAAQAEKLIAALKAKSLAKFWIDTRGQAAVGLLKVIAGG